MGQKILVVEDDKKIQDIIVEFLSSEGYSVDYADDGLEGYEKYEVENYDLIMIDVMMPKINGYELSKMIRKKDKDTPIIFLTALSEEDDEIKGFDLGCDDYITKPFSFKILTKRVEAAIKRSKCSYNDMDNLKYKDLQLNTKNYKLIIEKEEIELTLKEFKILHLLISSYPNVVSREQIIEKVWEYEYFEDTRVIDTHVKNLRKKIKANYIKTVKGIGYVLE